MRITDDNVHGRVVLTGDGIAIGEVSKLFIDGERFSISAIEVKLRKDPAERLGFTRSILHRPTLEIPTGLVRSVGDAVILTVPFDELRGLRTETQKPIAKTDEQPAHT